MWVSGLLWVGGAAVADSPMPLEPAQILAHLNRTVDWYHHLEPLEQIQVTADDAISRDRIRQESVTALRLAFDFGRAAAKQVSVPTAQNSAAKDSDATSSFSTQLEQSSDRLTQRITTLQAQIAALDERMAQAPAADRVALSAQRADATAALNLAREVQDSLQDMQRFQESALLGDSNGQGGLAAQVADLQTSVPEGVHSPKSVTAGTPATGVSAAAASTAPALAPATSTSNAPGFRPESAGVIALATEWLALHGLRSQLEAAIKETGSLLNEVASLRNAITAAVRKVVGTAFAVTTSSDPAQLSAQRAALEAGTATFKQLSTVLEPIGEQGLTLESTQNTLEAWRNSLNARAAGVSRYLVLKAGLLIASIAVVLIVSEIWRRATFRYLHDSRRRRQFLVLRRVAVWIALTFVIVFGLVSELGSIATYVGFLTAGIAVALQNVILAVVAYFFLIGRYGVRVGDRITLAGVTGRVIDIGLVRIYLMELAGPELHVSGRIVVLSNAVLFQPTALFKQIPGAEHVWHTVTLTIAATADVHEAQQRLKAAADAVYEKYRPSIERQYAIVQRLVDFETSTPQPQTRVRWTENGLECSVRYPVELENSASMDQQMLHALRAALAHDPSFALVTNGTLALKGSD